MNKPAILLTLIVVSFYSILGLSQSALVFQSDFGVKDGAVAAMKGVAFSVSPSLPIYDLTHEIPAFNVWEAAQRLVQTAQYWPEGTVFVSVVDPGVGTPRKSVALKTKSGHFFVTPDNGTLTLIAESLGIDAVREIDEAVNRLKNSQKSYTFHGRDVYAYTGARLAAGVISFEQVGAPLPPQVVSIPYQKATFNDEGIFGNIPILDIQFGNVWTNISRVVFKHLQINNGEKLWVKITHEEKIVFEEQLPFANTFGAVEKGQPLIYLNSINNVALGINQGNFAEVNHIQSGPDWNIRFWK